MELQLEQISKQQKESWNKFSPGWKKWDDKTMDFLKPSGDEIIRLLKPTGNDLILDVAAGTGEPGLTIAKMLNQGKVIVTDLSEGMLEVAIEKAKKQNITNLETKICDVSELPFNDNTFDAISCRFGFMFFPDMFVAAKEMARVLKPVGRIAASVWGVPEKNFWVTAIMGTIKKYMEIPPSPPDAPGIFRCAESGFIGNLFEQAGLKNVSESEITGKFHCESAEEYWNFMTEVAAPIVGVLSEADDKMKETIRNEVLQAIDQKYPNNIAIDTSANVIYAEK